MSSGTAPSREDWLPTIRTYVGSSGVASAPVAISIAAAPPRVKTRAGRLRRSIGEVLTKRVRRRSGLCLAGAAGFEPATSPPQGTCIMMLRCTYGEGPDDPDDRRRGAASRQASRCPWWQARERGDRGGAAA